MATFPFNKKKIFYVRVKSATIRHLLSRQESPLPIKLLTLGIKKKVFTANRIRIGAHRLEDERSTINL